MWAALAGESLAQPQPQPQPRPYPGYYGGGNPQQERNEPHRDFAPQQPPHGAEPNSQRMSREDRQRLREQIREHGPVYQRERRR
jgi:hypothetical protein